VFVDLLRLSILAQQSTKYSLSPHPEHFERCTGILGTLAATIASVSSLILGLDVTLVSRLRVYRVRLANNEAVLNQLSNVLSAVGCANLRCLVGVEPDLLFSAFQNRRREANRKKN
jgi:hypothetical protein